MAALTRAPVQRPRRRQAGVFAGAVKRADATTTTSAHRFADVGVQTETEQRTVERGALPLRYGIAAQGGGFETSPDDRQSAHGEDLLLWSSSPPLDLIEVHGDCERVVAVKAVDLGLEPYRTADGIERGFAPLLEHLRALLRFDPGKHTLHLELSGEPTKDQLEGLARLRDGAQRRAHETAIELDVHVSAPSGRATLRPPKL